MEPDFLILCVSFYVLLFHFPHFGSYYHEVSNDAATLAAAGAVLATPEVAHARLPEAGCIVGPDFLMHLLVQLLVAPNCLSFEDAPFLEAGGSFLGFSADPMVKYKHSRYNHLVLKTMCGLEGGEISWSAGFSWSGSAGVRDLCPNC